MAKRIGKRTYEVAAGIEVEPQMVERSAGGDIRQDGWCVTVDGEWDNDFRTKREAIAHAEILADARAANSTHS